MLVYLKGSPFSTTLAIWFWLKLLWKDQLFEGEKKCFGQSMWIEWIDVEKRKKKNKNLNRMDRIAMHIALFFVFFCFFPPQPTIALHLFLIFCLVSIKQTEQKREDRF